MPIPSELVLTLVGILIANGSLGFSYAILLSVLGGIAGSVLNYCTGWYFGNPMEVN